MVVVERGRGLERELGGAGQAALHARGQLDPLVHAARRVSGHRVAEVLVELPRVHLLVVEIHAEQVELGSVRRALPRQPQLPVAHALGTHQRARVVGHAAHQREIRHRARALAVEEIAERGLARRVRPGRERAPGRTRRVGEPHARHREVVAAVEAHTVELVVAHRVILVAPAEVGGEGERRGQAILLAREQVFCVWERWDPSSTL